jgi:hypothetical protein
MRFVEQKRQKFNVESQGRARLINRITFENLQKNASIDQVLTTNQWSGKRCFLIGGGPSLGEFDFDLLKGEKTIGVNRVFQFFHADINYSMDPNFVDRLRQHKLVTDPEESKLIEESWDAYKGIKASLVPLDYKEFDPGMHLIRRNRVKGIYRSFNEGIFPGNNSGFGALMLAIILGANPIYLLGYDLGCKEDATHFHSGYLVKNSVTQSEKTFEEKKSQQKLKLEGFRKMFDQFSSKIKQSGILVYNLNPSSELSCFEFDSVNRIFCKQSEVEQIKEESYAKMEKQPCI